MAETTVTSPAPRKRRRWLRVLGWVVGIFLVLVLILYFVVTSSVFLKAVILPKAGAALNATITVSDASVSPFSQVVFHNLKVQTTGTEPLLTASEVRARYHLMDILHGNIRVDEIALSAPTINLVENPDKTSNLDPLLKSQKPSAAQPAKPAQPSKPMQIDIRKVALTEGTLRQVTLYAGGNRDVSEISHLDLTVDNVKNGQTGKLAVSADLALDNRPPSPATNGMAQGKLEGNFNFTLSQDLKPAGIEGSLQLQISRAQGGLAQLASLGAGLNCSVTPTEIKQVALKFQRGDTPLAQILVSGPFDMEKTEGRLTVQLLNVDKNLLNVAGASSGLDFGPTTINSTNQIELASGGNAITTVGQFNLDHLQVTRTNQTTPALDLHAAYDVKVDRAASNILLRAFTLTGAQKGAQIIRGELAKPMTLSWGNAANAVGDSSLDLSVTRLDLADWKPFLGEVAPAGQVNAKVQLLSQQAGKQLSFDVNSKVDNLTVVSGSNQLSQLTVTAGLQGKAADLKQFTFPEYKLAVARQNQALVTASGSGTYDKVGNTADLQLTAQLVLARLLQLMPQPDMNVSSGTADLKVHVVQSPLTTNQAMQVVTGNLALNDFTGNVGSNSFQHFGTSADLEIRATPAVVKIQKLSGTLGEGRNSGGNFELSGTYGLSNHTAQLQAKLADLNQNGLRPFLQAMLGDKQLRSVSLNANASVQYDPEAASAVKADLEVTNLVVNDPKGQFPATPLAAKMNLDASLNKQVADVRQMQVGLTPTSRGTNQVQLTAHVDMSQTNALQGNLKLSADSLDLTSYYDLFGGGQNKTAATPTTPSPAQPGAPAPTTAGPEQEPPAKTLPVRNFTAEANIGRLYLHEVEITNLQLVSKIESTKVSLNPCKLSLNGAPVNTTVDLDTSVPGYKYAFVFNANAIPLAPLVNSFEPDRKGILSGTMTAQANINGAGTTGASLQKTLTGQFDVASTNLNLSVDSIQGKSASTRVLKFLIDTIAMIPELARNPAGGASSLLSGLVGGGRTAGATGGLSGDLKKSPINSIILRGGAGSGQVQLQQALVQSPAFQAQATGTITLAPVLTNSTIQIPVAVWLERGVAQRINLAGNTPPDAPYAKLPDFLTMTGTVGDPKRKINYAALGGALLQGIGGKPGQAGSALQGLSGLLGGKGATSPNPPGTNQQKGNLLQGLGGLLGSGQTNAPATNQSPVNNLFNRFLNPPK